MGKDTMKAVVFKGPGKVVIEDRPVPKIKDQTDIIVKVDKVHSTALHIHSPLTLRRQHYAEGTLEQCVANRSESNGHSELHVYRGHQKSGTDFIMGHEFTGHVHEVGSEVKKLKIGDHVVTPFTTCCGECFYCTHGFSSRCEKVLLFGSGPLDGGQAEYVRIPLADSTAVKAPPGIKEEALVLMADIFPTGMSKLPLLPNIQWSSMLQICI
jgi:threonine dehydrogenase-like Zn-dependent dehydrogenase